MPALILLTCSLFAPAASRLPEFGQREDHTRPITDDADFACVGASATLEDEECRAWQSIWLGACSAGGAACKPSPALCPNPLTDPCACRSPSVTINCAKPAPFFSRIRMSVIVLRSFRNHHWHVQPRQFAAFPTLGTLDIELPSDAHRGQSHLRGKVTKARAARGIRHYRVAAPRFTSCEGARVVSRDVVPSPKTTLPHPQQPKLVFARGSQVGLKPSAAHQQQAAIQLEDGSRWLLQPANRPRSVADLIAPHVAVALGLERRVPRSILVTHGGNGNTTATLALPPPCPWSSAASALLRQTGHRLLRGNRTSSFVAVEILRAKALSVVNASACFGRVDAKRGSGHSAPFMTMTRAMNGTSARAVVKQVKAPCGPAAQREMATAAVFDFLVLNHGRFGLENGRASNVFAAHDRSRDVSHPLGMLLFIGAGVDLATAAAHWQQELAAMGGSCKMFEGKRGPISALHYLTRSENDFGFAMFANTAKCPLPKRLRRAIWLLQSGANFAKVVRRSMRHNTLSYLTRTRSNNTVGNNYTRDDRVNIDLLGPNGVLATRFDCLRDVLHLRCGPTL